MAVIAKSYRDQLDRIKKNIRTSYEYFLPNYKRFHYFRRFTFKSSLSEHARAVLREEGKPDLEFNIIEAYMSRLLGEFSKQEPSIVVTAQDGAPVDLMTIKIVESYIRNVCYEANKNSCSYEVYKDLLSGGFSVVKVWVEYSHSMSMNKIIRMDRVFDPTLAGFDPLARTPHKGDGRWSFELFPKTVEDIKEQFDDVSFDRMSFDMQNTEGFNWSYQSAQGEDIVLLGDYYEKKKKRAKIVKLSNGRVMTQKSYENEFSQWWQDQGFIQQIPSVVGKARYSDIENICRYIMIGSQIVDYSETDYTYLPHIFIDGNSEMLREDSDNTVQQMTRPYAYQAEGIQKLKNYAGQSLAAELENTVQHKFIVKEEALPNDPKYIDALNNVQKANTIVVHAYDPNEPDKLIPEPIIPVTRTPIPPEITNTFTITDNMTQVILGSYDASLGINDNQLSGLAIIEAATQSNAAAMPYIVGFMQGWSRIGNVIASLIPKYYRTPRTIPVVTNDGKRHFIPVNQPNSPSLYYDDNALNVEIEAGVNFQIQKNKALQQIVALMQASESFAQFMNGPGLPILIKNLTIYGADQLQELIPMWQQQQAQMAQQQMQMQQQAMQNNPMVMKAQTERMKAIQDAKQNQVENQLKIAELAINKQSADTESIRATAEANQAQVDSAVQREKAQAEVYSHSVDAATKLAELHHKRKMDEHKNVREHVVLQHEIAQSKKQNQQAVTQ